MGLPLAEMATTVIRRTLTSESWYRGLGGLVRFVRSELMTADAGHLHHVLIRVGLRAGETAIVLVGLALVYTAFSVALYLDPSHAGAFVACGGLMTVACCVLSLRSAFSRQSAVGGFIEEDDLEPAGAWISSAEVMLGQTIVAPPDPTPARTGLPEVVVLPLTRPPAEPAPATADLAREEESEQLAA